MLNSSIFLVPITFTQGNPMNNQHLPDGIKTAISVQNDFWIIEHRSGITKVQEWGPFRWDATHPETGEPIFFTHEVSNVSKEALLDKLPYWLEEAEAEAFASAKAWVNERHEDILQKEPWAAVLTQHKTFRACCRILNGSNLHRPPVVEGRWSEKGLKLALQNLGVWKNWWSVAPV